MVVRTEVGVNAASDERPESRPGCSDCGQAFLLDSRCSEKPSGPITYAEVFRVLAWAAAWGIGSLWGRETSPEAVAETSEW